MPGCNTCKYHSRGPIQGSFLCTAGNQGSCLQWWSNNGRKIDQPLDDMPCFQKTESARMLGEMIDLVDKMDDLITYREGNLCPACNNLIQYHTSEMPLSFPESMRKYPNHHYGCKCTEGSGKSMETARSNYVRDIKSLLSLIGKPAVGSL